MMKLSLPTYSSALNLPKTIEAQTGLDCQLEPALHGFSLSQDSNDWYSRNDRLRPGLSLSVLKADLYSHFQLVAEAQSCSMLRFTFCLSGSLSVNYRSASNPLNITAHQSYLSATGGPVQLTSEFAAHQSLLLIRIDISAQLFKSLVGSRFKALAPDIRAISTGRQSGCCWQSSSLSAAAKVILYQLLKCPYQDDIRRLYLEGKVLELLAIQTQQFTEETQPLVRSPHLKPSDIERIHHAKHILINNLANPPSLASLAKQVNLNDYKLKQGFRQVFGTTAFGCLHQYRMEQAQLLLKERELNVAEISQVVGYANPSQFSAAFKKKFGVTPKAFQKY